MSDELLTKEAAAAYIGVSVRTLQRLASAGDIPRSEVPGPKGNEARFDKVDLDRYLEAQKPHALIRAGAALPAMTSDMTGGAAFELLQRIASALEQPRTLELPDELLTISEAAERTRLSMSLIERAIHADPPRITAKRLGAHGARLVKLSEVQDYAARLWEETPVRVPDLRQLKKASKKKRATKA